MAHEMDRPFIDCSALPDITKREMDFLDSSFFQSSTGPMPQLPQPRSIISQFGDGGKRAVILADLSMVVKIGNLDHLRLEEVQTMCAIRRAFPRGEIPVPEVFGWRRHDGAYGEQLFVYMSLMRGETLQAAWPSLTDDDKISLRNDLRRVVSTLRQLTQENSQNIGMSLPLPKSRATTDPIIASVNGGVVLDRFFRTDYEKGPFPSPKAFQDWMFAAATRQLPAEDGTINGLDHPDLCRDLLPDDAKVYFTHADLTLDNIMVSGHPGQCRVTAIIDWEQAGWYPEYWEFCKMHFGAAGDHEWLVNEWPSKILEADEAANWAFTTYYLWRTGGT